MDFFTQMSQLVQYIESSVLNNIRILLLDPLSNIYLIKSLYGILMILPQGKAFAALYKRLKNLETLMLMDSKSINLSKTDSMPDSVNNSNSDVEIYLREFEKAQHLKKN